MTSLFQTLIDFLDLLLQSIYNVLAVISNYIWGALTLILFWIVSFWAVIVNSICYALIWIVDKFFVMSITGINTLFGTNGFFTNMFSNDMGGSYTTCTNFVSRLISFGAVGVTWVKNFVPVSSFVTPFVFYIGFLLIWSIYRFVKSWIPTLSG